MAFEGRTIILSDTHLGAPQKSAGPVEKFAPLLANTRHLIINGDVLELRPKRCALLAWEENRRLEEMCRRAGVTLTRIAGNHDPQRDWPAAIELFDSEVLVTHGHGFHPAIAPWCKNASYLRTHFDQALQTARKHGLPDQLDTMLACSLMACETEPDDMEPVNHHKRIFGLLFRPGDVAKLMMFWREIPALASHFASRYAPAARYVIFGHSHHEGIWNVDGRTIINTGSYAFPGKPWAVVVENNHLAVHPLLRRPDGYHLSKRATATFEMKTRQPAERMKVINATYPGQAVEVA